VSRAPAGFFPGGLVGYLIRTAFAGFSCPQCGPIPKSEFSPADQSSMTMGTLGYVFGGLAVLVILIVVLIFIASLGSH
jgi:hypothetical protein